MASSAGASAGVGAGQFAADGVSYIGALLAEPGDRKSCWQLAELAGRATPRRMQALAEYAWDWKAALAALQRVIVAQLGRPDRPSRSHLAAYRS